MLWGDAPISYLMRLQTLQNRILKVIYRKPVLTPTLTLYNDYVKDILPIKGMQVFAICKFVRQSIQGTSHRNLTFPRQLRIESSRDPLKLAGVRALSGWGLCRISFQGPTFYNNLPKDIRKELIFPCFLRQLKPHLLQLPQLSILLDYSYR